MVWKSGWVLLVSALAACGGLSSSNETEPPPSDAGVSGSNSADCGSAPVEDESGCGGEGGQVGEKPLETYARLRAACRLNVKPNRRGAPVTVDCHIK